jgi:hypothetical protein
MIQDPPKAAKLCHPKKQQTKVVMGREPASLESMEESNRDTIVYPLNRTTYR